jgi:CopG family nickel-responsive transcriptional regulator
MSSDKDSLRRISISLPESLLLQFDQMVAEKDSDSRSQAIAEMIHQQLNEHRQKIGEQIMAGTINLVYDHSVPSLQKKLTDLQYKYLDEVISCLNVNLSHEKTLSVILVQGPGEKLKMIANEMITNRGVLTGKIVLSTAIIPPVHPLPNEDA